MAETKRQQIARLLRQGPHTALDISRKVRSPVRAVLSDLQHIERSLGDRARLVQRSAECLSCGFVFEGRKRFETPSRCPRCRNEHIQDPEFSIEDR